MKSKILKKLHELVCLFALSKSLTMLGYDGPNYLVYSTTFSLYQRDTAFDLDLRQIESIPPGI